MICHFVGFEFCDGKDKKERGMIDDKMLELFVAESYPSTIYLYKSPTSSQNNT
jgi:hypothetical protein